jgi:Ser/Thr protein kinase RdoA (MazF antagonist)
MVFEETPLGTQVLEAVARYWGINATQGERLHGGEESSAYRLADHVVRIGPSWRSEAELEWAHAIAVFAARALPEAISPISTTTGVTVLRVDGRLVSVWPFRSGTWPHKFGGYEDQAARLLARLHSALIRIRVPSRPGPGPSFAPAPELEDAELDRWLHEFDRTFNGRHPLHGDFYPGNTLVVAGQIVGLLDWDDTFVGPPERELAWAAWEWGAGLRTMDLNRPLHFIDEYVSAGGPAHRIDEIMLRQLVRERLRREVRYGRSARARGVPHNADDYRYESHQLDAFRALRPRTGMNTA